MSSQCLRRVPKVLGCVVREPPMTQRFGRRWFQASSLRLNASNDGQNAIPEQVRLLMRRVTQPVVLVTTEDTNSKTRRGLTVSSFTTICLTPSPFVCFSTRKSSRAADLISQRQQFVIHLLPCTTESAKIAEAFSKSDLAPHATHHHQNPFELGKWTRHDRWDLSVLDGELGALLCKVDRTVDVGDHRLWIGEVQDILTQPGQVTALAYCGRRYRGQGSPIWPHDTSEE